MDKPKLDEKLKELFELMHKNAIAEARKLKNREKRRRRKK